MASRQDLGPDDTGGAGETGDGGDGGGGHDADPAREPSGVRALVGWGQATAGSVRGRAQRTLDDNRHRLPVDVALRIYERDRETAGTVVSSAVAFRLFLFFVPFLLFVVGLAGFLSSQIGPGDVSGAGITGSLAREIDGALTQPSSSRWIATVVGLVGMATTGRTLSKVMSAASCLGWGLPVSTKASVRIVGSTVGLVVGIGIVATLVNRLRQDLGIGVAGVSFVVAFAIYAAAWLVLTLALPRATSDPGALLPGSILVGFTVATLQAISQLYLPDRFDRASQLYGTLGAVIVTLGWFFIIGRAIVLSFVVNGAVYERVGSVSTLVFGLPVLRVLPRRWPWFRHFFELDGGA